MSEKIAVFIRSLSNSCSLNSVLRSVELALRNYEYTLIISVDEEEYAQKIKNEYPDAAIYIHPATTGINTIRNELVSEFRTADYLLKLDDDFELGGEFDFQSMLTVFKADSRITVVTDLERQLGSNRRSPSGSLRPYSYKLLRIGRILFKISRTWSNQKRLSDGVQFIYTEYARNLLLIKLDNIQDYRWDDCVVFKGEHLSFYFDMKMLNKKCAVSLNSIHYHRDDYKRYAIGKLGVSEKANITGYKKLVDDKIGVKSIMNIPDLRSIMIFLRVC